MKYQLLLLLALAAFLGFQHFQHAVKSQNDIVWNTFSEWKATQNVLYENQDEEIIRYEIFRANYEFIEEFNAENNGVTLSLNKFADLSLEEFSVLFTGRKQSLQVVENYATFDVKDLPTSIDWRTQNAVTPVKDQGQCGSCWAFSTIGGLEGVYAIVSGTLASFSEQQIVDCSHNGGNSGCDGGDLPPAFDYVCQYGIEAESDYPYKAVDQKCKYDKSKVVFTPDSYKMVTPNAPDQMAAALATQPLSICIEADSSVFQFYTSGVLNSKQCGTDLDHCVTLVGYDDTAATPYWIVKNSWGEDWGNDGYIWIYKSMTNNAGICGINEEPGYPTWSK